MTQHRPGLAALWMMGAISAFSLMAIAGRYTAAELDTFELMMFRSFVGIVLVLGFGAVFGTLNQVNTQKIHLHFFRNIFHFAGQNLWFFALSLIPLAQLVALEFTTPIWVILLSPVFLGEGLTRMKIFAAVLGFSGIVIVARPDFGQLDAGIIAGVTCAIGFAGAMIFTKVLTRTASVTCILFWLVTFQFGFGILTSAWDGDVTFPSWTVLPWVVVVGCCGLAAHLSLTKALTYAPASMVGPMDFFRLPVIAVIGMVLFSEPLEIAVFAGAALIFAANYLNIRTQTRPNP